MLAHVLMILDRIFTRFSLAIFCASVSIGTMSQCPPGNRWTIAVEAACFYVLVSGCIDRVRRNLPSAGSWSKWKTFGLTVNSVIYVIVMLAAVALFCSDLAWYLYPYNVTLARSIGFVIMTITIYGAIAMVYFVLREEYLPAKT